MTEKQQRARSRHRLAPLQYAETDSEPALAGIDELLRSYVQPRSAPDVVCTVVEDISTPGVVPTPAVDETPGVVTTPHLDRTPGSAPKNAPRIRKCTVCQDGHTQAEEVVYQKLWTAKRGEPEGSDRAKQRNKSPIRLVHEDPATTIREVEASLNALASATAMTRRNCSLNVERLCDKLSIKRIDHGNSVTGTPARYLVYPYATILARRKAAGLTHVIRSKGAGLVNEHGVDPRPRSLRNERVLAYAEKDRATRMRKREEAAPKEGKSTPGIVSTSARGVEPTPQLGSKHLGIEIEKQTTSNDVDDREVISCALSAYALVDEKAITQMLAACRLRSATCSAEDIAEAIHEKGAQIQGNPTIRNPLGTLLSIVPDTITAVQRRRTFANARERSALLEQQKELRREEVRRRIAAQPNDNPWARFMGWACERIDPHSVDTWLRPTRYAGSADSTVTVCVPTAEFKGVGARFKSQIVQANEELNLGLEDIRFVTIDDLALELSRVSEGASQS